MSLNCVFLKFLVSASNNPMYTTPQQFNTNTPPPVQGSQPPPAINAAQRTPFYHGQHHQRMPQSAHMMRPNRGGNGNHPHQQGVPPQQQQYHMPIPQLQYGAPVIVMQPQVSNSLYFAKRFLWQINNLNRPTRIGGERQLVSIYKTKTISENILESIRSAKGEYWIGRYLAVDKGDGIEPSWLF